MSSDSLSEFNPDRDSESPIHALPTETLGVIFEWVTVGSRLSFPRARVDTDSTATDHPLFILGQVCHLWRACTLAEGDLWARLRINVYEEFQRTQSGVRQSWILNNFLERSKSALLDLHVTLQGSGDVESDTFDTMARLIGDSSRWFRVHLWIWNNANMALIRVLETYDLGRLKTFSVQGNPPPSVFTGEERRMQLLQSAVNLDSLTISYLRVPLQFRAEGLRALSLRGPHVPEDLLFIAAQCAALEKLTLSLEPCSIAPPETLIQHPPLNLSSLRELSIKTYFYVDEDDSGSDGYESINLALQKLVVPNLNAVGLSIADHSRAPHEPLRIAPESLADSLSRLLRDSPTQKLMIGETCPLEFFTAMRSITSIELNTEDDWEAATRRKDEFRLLTLDPKSPQTESFPYLRHLLIHSPHRPFYANLFPRPEYDAALATDWEGQLPSLIAMVASRCKSTLPKESRLESVVITAFWKWDLERAKEVMGPQLGWFPIDVKFELF